MPNQTIEALKLVPDVIDIDIKLDQFYKDIDSIRESGISVTKLTKQLGLSRRTYYHWREKIPTPLFSYLVVSEWAKAIKKQTDISELLSKTLPPKTPENQSQTAESK